VGRVHYQHVRAGLHQRRRPLSVALAHPNRRPHAQLLGRVFAGIRIFAGLLDVLYGHQAAQPEFVVHDQHLLDAVLMQQAHDLRLAVLSLAHGDQAFPRRHHGGYRVLVAGLEAQIAVGDDADQAPVVNHRDAGDAVRAGQSQHFADGGVRRHGKRVADHGAGEFLDRAHLLRLVLGAHVLVDEADAARLRQGNGHRGLGHRIHGRRDQGDVQNDVARQPRLQAHPGGQHFGICRHQQHIVESQSLLEIFHSPLHWRRRRRKSPPEPPLWRPIISMRRFPVK